MNEQFANLYNFMDIYIYEEITMLYIGRCTT